MKSFKVYSLRLKIVSNEIAVLSWYNVMSIRFVDFLFQHFILRRKHAQYGYCEEHPRSILFNGDCVECWQRPQSSA